MAISVISMNLYITTLKIDVKSTEELQKVYSLKEDLPLYYTTR